MIAAGNSTRGQQVTFELIPGVLGANDMSPDGRYIVGDAVSGPYLYDCETKTMTILPPPAFCATAVSDDGTVVVGDIPDPTGVGLEVAGRWTQATGWVSLGFLPNALACPSRSNAYEVSADGNVVVGLSWDGCSGRGFVWTQQTGMLELEPLANGGNRASVVSADGTLIGGFAQGSFSRTPCFWTGDQDGTLLDPPNGDALGEIHGIQDDGLVMLGEWNGDASTWTLNGSSWDRATIGAGSIISTWTGIPTDIADDGTIIGFDILQGNRRAWIQYQGQGNLLVLKDWANLNGANIPAAQQLEVAQAISSDGSKIIGHGFQQGAWIITITPDFILGDVNGDGVVNLLDVQPFVVLLTTGGFQIEADINMDGVVDLLDVAGFVVLLTGG
jgi:uncharacterized membrane protein